MHRNIKRLIPFVMLLLLIILVYVFNGHEFFTLGWLRKEELNLNWYVHNHRILSVLIYLVFYIGSVCLIIPDSTILTLLGGLVFPLPLAIVYAVLAETIGATAFFWIFQSAFGTRLLKRERPILSKLRRGFQEHEISYLLFLRISHVIPFWCTNVAAAYFKVNRWTFVWTTFLGVLPLTTILTYAGHSLHVLFAQNTKLKISDIFTTEIKIALIALGIIALCPIIYKKFIAKKKWKL